METDYKKGCITLQKRVNLKQKKINKLSISIEEKNYSLSLFNRYFDKLIQEGKITKQELSDNIKSKAYSKQMVKEHRLKHGGNTGYED